MHCCVPASERCREFDKNKAGKLHPKRGAWLYISRLSTQYTAAKKVWLLPVKGGVLGYEYASSSLYKRRPYDLIIVFQLFC